jgi:hydrogenase small subunit
LYFKNFLILEGLIKNNMGTKTSTNETYLQSIERQGYSRRDFMKFVAFIGAYMGIESSALGQVAKALATTPRLPVIWEHFQECTCCSESFIRSDHPIVADIILDKISLDYTLTLMAASGHQAEAAKKSTMEKYKGKYILCVEGSVPIGDDGNYCVIAGRTAIDILKESAKDAAAIIAWGSCATTGCVQAAKPNPTGAVPINKIITDKPIINVPGCPPIGEVMAGVIVHYVAFGKLPELDAAGRPKAFYSKRVHDSCYRRPYFDAGHGASAALAQPDPDVPSQPFRYAPGQCGTGSQPVRPRSARGGCPDGRYRPPRHGHCAERTRKRSRAASSTP